MADQPAGNLIMLGEADRPLERDDEDVRGYDVVDSGGDEIGQVEDLVVDEDERKVRFLRVKGGGFLGIGGKTWLVPVDAIAHIDADTIRLDRTRDEVGRGPAYDPGAPRDTGFWNTVYGHYGFAPYWTAGYGYPSYPYYGADPNDPDRRSGI